MVNRGGDSPRLKVGIIQVAWCPVGNEVRTLVRKCSTFSGGVKPTGLERPKDCKRELRVGTSLARTIGDPKQ